MTTALVETSEEDSFLAVGRHIGDLLNEGQERTALADTPGSRFTAECETLLAESRSAELLDVLVAQYGVLFSKAADGDLECCLNIINHLVERIPQPHTAEAVQKLAAALTEQVYERFAEQQLQGLVQLYNLTADSKVQFRLVLDAIAFAKAANLPGLLVPVLRGRVESWIKEWDLSIPDQQKLYLAVDDLLRSSKRQKAGAKEAAKLTARALASCDDASPQELVGLKGIAASAVADFIRSPDVYQFDLMESPAVRQLEGDAQDGPLLELLSTILDGDVQGLDAFVEEHAAKLESLAVQKQELVTKTRLMALLALASTAHDIDFATIQERLGLTDEAEVEPWLVAGMGKKLIEGTIDQPQQVVHISRASLRAFSSRQWEHIHRQLAAWKESVHSVRDLLTAQRENGMQPVAA